MATSRFPTTANSPLETKGDLFTYSTGSAKLAVGNNGESLVADSSTSTGLRWQGDYAAGKNKIINGDFGIWQRGTSFSNPTNGTYTTDRWRWTGDGTGATRTVSQQTFTPGTAPVAGYENSYFLRHAVTVASTNGTYNGFQTRLEDVRIFAGQTVTLSFWAKANTASTLFNNLTQNFGSGGSSSVTFPTVSNEISITTSWARYSVNISFPSISGKTIGTSSYLQVYFGCPINVTQEIDFWGVQLEAGSTATAFQTATGTIQGELAAAQRYYFRANAASTFPKVISTGGSYYTTTACYAGVPMPIEMRTVPTLTTGTVGSFSVYSAGTSRACSAIALGNATPNLVLLNCTTAAATAGNSGWLESTSTTNSFLEFSAEL